VFFPQDEDGVEEVKHIIDHNINSKNKHLKLNISLKWVLSPKKITPLQKCLSPTFSNTKNLKI